MHRPVGNLSTGWVLDTPFIGGSTVLYIKPTGFDTTKGKFNGNDQEGLRVNRAGFQRYP